MLFSVLIAHYNNTAYLPAALESVIRQSHRDWEVILVDDASTEDFDTTVDPYLKDDRIRVYRNERNMGCGFTKNRCASLASGALMGFLDPDDALLQNALERLILMHQVRPDCSLIHSTHFVCDDHLSHCRIADYVKPLPEGVSYLMLNDGRIHHFATFKKGAYLQTPGINKQNLKAVDQDLYYLLEEQGPVHFLDEPLYLYRIHSRGISTSGKEAEAKLWHLEVIMKACKRRISKLRREKGQHKAQYRSYRRKLQQAKIQHDYRTRKWCRFLLHSMQYPFFGGGSHLLAYSRKLFYGGPAVLRKSFREDHRITP